MAQAWTFEEDYIVCKFYLEHTQSWKEDIESLMALLRENDFLSRDKGSVNA